MRDAKVRPIMVGSSYHLLDRFDESQSEGDGNAIYGIINGVNSQPGSLEYRLARREFLKSYSFSSSVCRRDRGVFNDGRWLKGKFAKSVRDASDAAVGAIVDVRRGISRRRLAVRVLRVKLSLFASPDRTFVISARCFVPCINKVEI